MSRIYNWESRAIKPEKPANNASSFAQWVFSQSNNYINHKSSISDLKNKKRGRAAHLAIDHFFQMDWARNNLDSESSSDWIIEHTESDGISGKYYQANSLKLNNKALNCSPDLILRHKHHNKVVIIERKTTFVPAPKIPTNGWPNVQAQLWCYSWMDSMLDVDEVILVGQLWHHISHNAVSLCHTHPMWKRDDKDFHQRCLHWFELYGGKFNLQVTK